MTADRREEEARRLIASWSERYRTNESMAENVATALRAAHEAAQGTLWICTKDGLPLTQCATLTEEEALAMAADYARTHGHYYPHHLPYRVERRRIVQRGGAP